MSSASSLIRCFWRMITTSDAVHVAAARSNVSTGDVAVRESPSTRIGGRPFPSPSNCSCCFHRTVTSAVRGGATSVPSARRQTHIHPMPMYHIEGAVFHQPIECRAIMQLEAEGEIGPQTGTVWIGGTNLAPRGASIVQESVHCNRRGGPGQPPRVRRLRDCRDQSQELRDRHRLAAGARG